MWDVQTERFVPVPESRDLTDYERKLIKFQEGERVFVKGMSFTVAEIHDRSLVLTPVLNAAVKAEKKED